MRALAASSKDGAASPQHVPGRHWTDRPGTAHTISRAGPIPDGMPAYESACEHRAGRGATGPALVAGVASGGSTQCQLRPGLQDIANEPIQPRSFPVELADCRSGYDARDRPAEHITEIVRADIDARQADQEGPTQEGEAAPPESMEQKACCDRECRRRVIGRKRPVAAAADDEMTHAGIVRADPMYEQQNELIEAQPDKEG